VRYAHEQTGFADLLCIAPDVRFPAVFPAVVFLTNKKRCPAAGSNLRAHDDFMRRIVPRPARLNERWGNIMAKLR
jgi:hypothetical protein